MISNTISSANDFWSAELKKKEYWGAETPSLQRPFTSLPQHFHPLPTSLPERNKQHFFSLWCRDGVCGVLGWVLIFSYYRTGVKRVWYTQHDDRCRPAVHPTSTVIHTTHFVRHVLTSFPHIHVHSLLLPHKQILSTMPVFAEITGAGVKPLLPFRCNPAPLLGEESSKWFFLHTTIFVYDLHVLSNRNYHMAWCVGFRQEQATIYCISLQS